MERNGGLEVEVVQARGLTMKPGSKGPPGETDPTGAQGSKVSLLENTALLLFIKNNKTMALKMEV